MGPQDKVEVVGHQAVGEDAHREAFAGQADQLDERRVIVVIVEDGGAGVSSVEDVVAEVGG